MPETRATTKKARTTWAGRLAYILLGILLFGIVFLYSVMYFGPVDGEEFSPDTFGRRSFHYLEIPLIGVQITPISHDDKTGDLEKYLVAQTLIPKSTTAEPRWDLVVAMQGAQRAAQGDARILCEYLDAVDKDQNNVWLTWSETNVELAKVLWPAVAEVAHQELYSFVPDLLRLAQAVSDPDKLQDELDQTLARKYVLAARSFQALERHEQAVELFSLALKHVPEAADSLKGRAESLKALGKRPEAEADLAQVQRLESE